jgi:TRAP-type C4-dicarboxylate transport system substrate-binding protein
MMKSIGFVSAVRSSTLVAGAWRTISSVLVLGTLMTSPLVNAQTTLRFSNWLPPTHHVVTEMVQPWIADVDRVTEGRVKIQVVPALGAPPTHFDLVKNGVADVAFGVHAYTPTRFKLTELGELPFTADHSVVNSLAYWRTYQKYFAKANEHEGVVLLGLWTNGPYQLFTKENALTNLDAVKGIKIRVPGTTVEKITKALGMAPISSPVTEAYEQISRGVIQGMFQQKETVIAFKMTQHMPTASFVPGGFAHSSQFMIVNEAKWKALESRDREAIEKLSGEAMVRRFAAVWQAKEDAALGQFAQMGVKVTPVGDALLTDLRGKLKFVADEWLTDALKKSPDAKAAMDEYYALIPKIAGELGVKP